MNLTAGRGGRDDLRYSASERSNERADGVGRKHSYKDYNITLWVSSRDGAWEFVSVVSGPMTGDKYAVARIDGTSPVSTEEDAYECGYEAAVRHIDSR